MENYEISNSIVHLNNLKKDVQLKQKKGLPFIMSSVILWGLIAVIQLMDLDIMTRNMYTFMCSCLLMPLATMFAKIVKAKLYERSRNPISKLGFLCTMNQILYLSIVMWAYSQKPESMMMLYAIIFGAHLFPFGWVYDSKAYLGAALLNTAGVIVIGSTFGSAAAAAFVAVVELILTICLFIELRRVRETN